MQLRQLRNKLRRDKTELVWSFTIETKGLCKLKNASAGSYQEKDLGKNTS